MRCPRCQKESPMGAEYCTRCGASLYGRIAAGDGLPEIRQQMNEIAVRLSRVEGQVTLISERVGLEPIQSQPAVGAPDKTDMVELSRKATIESVPVEAAAPQKPVVAESMATGPVRVAPVAEKGGAETAAATARPLERPAWPHEPSRSAPRMREWELSLPGNWLSRIGMLVLFIGLGFLTQWAIVNHKLERLPLLLVGLACGGVLLFAGHHWRKAYGAWAQALTGGGIGVLYLSFFASYALYDKPVMPFYATFALMFLVTVVAVAIALRRESMAIAIIGIVGAFLVPIVLSASDLHKPAEAAGEGNPGLMIAYILLLDAGIVWLSTFRNWRWFTILGFAGSLAVYGLWYANSGHEGPVSVAEWSLTGIFLCFVAATTLFHVVARRAPQLTDLVLMSVNAAVYFCVSYALLWGKYQEWLGLFSIGLCALYAMIGYLARRRSEDNRLLSLFAFAISIVLLTIAIPVQLHRSYASWITTAWAAEGAALIWISVRQKMPGWQLWGLGAFAMAVVGLLTYNRAIDAERFRPFVNDTFWAFTTSIVALYVAAFFLSRDKSPQRVFSFPAVMLTASFLTVWLFSAEIISYARSAIIEARADGATSLELRNIENARSIVLVALWGAYSLCMVVAGVRKSWGWLRIGGYALIGITGGAAVTLLNHGHAMVRSGGSDPVINYSFGGLLISICAIYAAAYLMASHTRQLLPGEKAILPVPIVAANTLSLYALSSEVLTYVNSASGRSMGLTMLWAAYGIVLIVAGVLGKWPWVRVGGLALVSVAVLKLFILDTLRLDAGYRVGAYITVGILLLAGGFVYHRYADVIKGFIMDRTEKGSSSDEK